MLNNFCKRNILCILRCNKSVLYQRNNNTQTTVIPRIVFVSFIRGIWKMRHSGNVRGTHKTTLFKKKLFLFLLLVTLLGALYRGLYICHNVTITQCDDHFCAASHYLPHIYYRSQFAGDIPRLSIITFLSDGIMTKKPYLQNNNNPLLDNPLYYGHNPAR